MNITVIGVSTGGPRVLRELFRDLPRLNTCVLLVQHMPGFLNETVRRRLSRNTAMDVRLAGDGDALAPGVVFLAPSERHLEVIHNRRIRLVEGEKVNFVRPSADVAMRSLMAVAGDRLIGIVMTGLGSDGALGIRHIKQLGGLTLVQDEKTSTIFGMPKAAVDTGYVDYEGAPRAIRRMLIETVGELRDSLNPRRPAFVEK